MKINYRPEIDGLRAIAVVAVILYHTQITILGHQPFKGGFIGVDIFFVISGYLITSIIIKELITTGTFSYKHFYERRIRRILPALLLVMVVSLPFAWIYLTPSSLIDFSKSILYSLGFSSNFYFHYSGQEYGATSGLVKPFLHTWSLSAEEQYYILFPIVLLVTFKYFKKYLIHILILSFVISLGLADWGSRNYPSATFYLLHSRMWEIIAGSILAYFEIVKGRKKSKYQILNSTYVSVGLLLIILSIIFFKKYFPHPSFHTLPSIIGVCLIIWFSNKNEIVTKILSSKPLIRVGLISYSLYLWHYPIFAFDRLLGFTSESIFNKLLLGIIILTLSILSYYFIERPARNKKYKFKKIFFIIFLIYIFLIIINIIVVQNFGFKNRLESPEFFQKTPTYNYLKKDSKTCFNNLDICKFNINKKNSILLIGDSHFGGLAFNLKSRIDKYQFVPITAPSYFYFYDKNIISTNKTTIKKNNFEELNLIVEQELNNSKNNIIILGGNTSLYFYKKRYIDKPIDEGFEFVNKNNSEHSSKLLEDVFYKQLKQLTKNNYVILIYPTPEMGKNDLFNTVKSYENFKFTFDDYMKINNQIIKYFNEINLNNLIKVKPVDILCDKLKNSCPIYDKKNKNYIYSDAWHLSLYGSQLINDLIMKEIEKIELKSTLHISSN